MSTVVAAAKEKSKTREVVVDPDWCAGCGDFGVLKSLKTATTDNGVKPHELLLVSGIGCSSNLPGFETYSHPERVELARGRHYVAALDDPLN